ncbi:MAG: MCE family protein [Solirubrobacteraceae bacterium]|nr:MCE family protein [Solirubrobacteraceae bacterium]
MNRRRSSLLAHPVLIGAAGILIALVTVVISYNANSGLPFVETYDITARVDDAKKLTTGTDVRIAGKRVGQVNDIRADEDPDGRPYASLSLQLDRVIAPLPADTTARIRPRSVLGAKFVELIPGDSARSIPAGGTIRRARTSAATDLDEVTAAFDAGTRRGVRQIITELSTGLAGRGASFNAALVRFPPVLDDATRAFRVLNDPRTDLGGFVRGLASLLTAIEPRAGDLRPLLRDARTTFAALADEGTALRRTLAALPSTLDEADRASVALRPVLRDATELASALRPGLRELRPAARELRIAAVRGTPVLRRARILGPRFEQIVDALDRALTRPSAPAVLDRLTRGGPTLVPIVRELEGVQVRCNYAGLFARNASSFLQEGDRYGHWFRVVLALDVADTLRTIDPNPELHNNPYPDVDTQGCAIGNETYAGGTVHGGRGPATNIRTSVLPPNPDEPR